LAQVQTATATGITSLIGTSFHVVGTDRRAVSGRSSVRPADIPRQN
jgi:hypothetical protein